MGTNWITRATLVAAMACLSGSSLGQPDPTGATPPSVPTSTAPSEERIGPRIVVNPKVFDFGDVWEGQPAKGEFTIRNSGDEALEIDAKSSCGCTIVTKPKSPLAPGEETTFEISYSTNRRGKAHKRVTLTTNDPYQKQVPIDVRGEVKPLFEFQPVNHVAFRDLDANTRATESIALINQFSEPVALRLNEERPVRGFDVELVAAEPGRKYELRVSTQPPLAIGWTRSTVVLETDRPELPRLSVPLSANVPPRVAVQPDKLFVTSHMRNPLKRTVRIQYRKDNPVQIEKIVTTPVQMETSINPPAADDSTGKLATHLVQVTLPGYDELPEDGGTVVIHTDDPSGEFTKLVIPIVKRPPPRGADLRASNPTQEAEGVSESDLSGLDEDALRQKIMDAIKRAGAEQNDANKPKPKDAGSNG